MGTARGSGRPCIEPQGIRFRPVVGAGGWIGPKVRGRRTLPSSCSYVRRALALGSAGAVAVGLFVFGPQSRAAASGVPAVATTVFDAATNLAWGGTETTGASAYDTSQVSGVVGVTP